MNGLAMPVSCLGCGAPTRYVNGSANVTWTVAIVACGSCNKQWEITAHINPHRAQL